MDPFYTGIKNRKDISESEKNKILNNLDFYCCGNIEATNKDGSTTFYFCDKDIGHTGYCQDCYDKSVIWQIQYYSTTSN